MHWAVGRSLDSKGRRLRLLGELTGCFPTLNKGGLGSITIHALHS